MKKIFFAAIVVLALCVVPGVGWAETNVPYLDHEGKLQETEADIEVKVLENSGDFDEPLNAGWYIVRGDIPLTDMITIEDEVHLILEDDCHLQVTTIDEEAAILVNENDSLTIYAQSTDTNIGRLTAITTGTSEIGRASCRERV